MKVFQLSTYDLAGGAERVAWHLFEGLLRRGIDSWLIVGRTRSRHSRVLSLPNDPKRSAWSRFWRRRSQGRRLSNLLATVGEPQRILDRLRGREDFHHPGARSLLRLAPGPPDLIHLHNLHGDYFDLRMLPRISATVPTVMTLHDAWLLTGHCAHSFECDRWRIGCGRCPDLTIYPAIRRDATRFNWLRKKALFRRSRLFVSTPCAWLMRKVEDSILMPGIVERRVIPYGIDLSVFHPRSPQSESRAPSDPLVLLFASHGVRASPWRDYRLLLDALEHVAGRLRGSRRLLVKCVGEQDEALRVGSAEVRFLPFEHDREAMASHYRSADVYVHPARADTFPNAVLEAMACGLAIIRTRTGACDELVEHGLTALVVPPEDPGKIALCVRHLLSHPGDYERLRTNGRRVVEQRFSLDRMVATIERDLQGTIRGVGDRMDASHYHDPP